MKVSVDWGFGYTKAVSEEGRRVYFPSVITPMSGEDLFPVTTEYEAKIRANGEEVYYLAIGSLALHCDGICAWKDDYFQNRNIVYLLSLAVALLSDGHPVQLTVGLPMKVFYHQKDKVKEMLDGFKAEVTLNSGQRTVNIEEAKILPQAAGVFYSQLLDMNGNIRDRNLIKQKTGVIDVGFRTTDILAMQKDSRGLLPRKDLADGMDEGINNSQRKVREVISREVKDDVPLEFIEKALAFNGGVLFYKGKNFDLSEYMEKTNRTLASRIIDKVSNVWGKEVDDMRQVIIGGGGGNDLLPYLREEIPHTVLADDAFFANAKGFLAATMLR